MTNEDDKRRLAIKADKLIRKHALSSGVFGYAPFPVLDGLGIMVVQRTMLKQLAKNYKVSYSRSLAKDLLNTLVGGVVSRAAMPIALKMIPGVGVLLGSTGMAAIGSASTFAVGKVFKQHFERGGTMKNFDAKQNKKTYEAELNARLKLLQAREKGKPKK